jgi:NADH-quinone oxidoreductase subunit K
MGDLLVFYLIDKPFSILNTLNFIEFIFKSDWFVLDFIIASIIIVLLAVVILSLWALVIIRSNYFSIVLSLELAVGAIVTGFVLLGFIKDDAVALLVSLFFISAGACHSASILSYLVVFYRLRGTVDVDFLIILKDLGINDISIVGSDSDWLLPT